MSILKINEYGDSILREKAEFIDKVKSKDLDLIDDMIETMLEADGIGLAANQINVPKSIAVINLTFFDETMPPQAFLNIELLESNGKNLLEEGCLSIPGVREEVKRPEHIKISYRDVFGERKTLECRGLLARVFLHELDHLNGVLFVDRLSSVKRKLLDKKLKNIVKSKHIS